MHAVTTGHHKGMIAEVTVMGLIIIDGPGIFGPELDLVELQVTAGEQSFSGVHEVWIDREPI